MNTLKMKVLLFFSNHYLHRAFGQAMLIWIITCLGGCVVLYWLEGLPLPPILSILLSLLFSSPALLIATSFLYHLTSLSTRLIRVFSAIALILLTSAAITALVTIFFHLRFYDVAETLLIFIPFALVSFFLVARKQVQSKTTYA